jgi:hypothetical protein
MMRMMGAFFVPYSHFCGRLGQLLSSGLGRQVPRVVPIRDPKLSLYDTDIDMVVAEIDCWIAMIGKQNLFRSSLVKAKIELSVECLV